MALVQKYQADVARAEAEYQTGIAQAQRLTADANALWNGPRRQGIRALLLAIEAHKRLPTAENARVLLEMNRLLPEVVGTFSQGTGPMALSPSADRLFVGRQNAVHVFAVADGRALAKFSVPDSVWILHLNAAGVLLAVARGPDHSHLTDTSPSTVEIRRTSDLVTLRTVAFNRPVLAMNFAANDALVATDFSTVKSIGGAPGADSEWHINGYPSTVAISNSGQTIAVALGQTIHLLSTPSGKEIRVISSPRDNDDLIEDLVFSADDRFLLSSTLFADSRIWDLTNPHAAARTIGKKIDAGGTLIWSPDSKRVAQLGVGSNLCVWNAKDGKAIAARLTETEPLFGDFAPGAFFLSPEVILAWSSSNAGSLYTLAAESQIVENNGRLNHAEVKYQLSETQRMVFDGHILQLVADERRGVAAGCSAAGDGAIWKLASGSDEIAGQIRFSASGNFFQQMHRKSLSIYKTDDSEQRDAGAPPTWTSDRELGLGEFSADDKYFAASDDAGVVRLYDTKSFAEVTQVPSSNKKRREIRYVPAADVFVIAGNGKVTELSPRTLKSRERLAYPNRDNEVFSSKARFFATWDKSRSPDDIDVSPEKTKRASLAVYDLEKNERLWEVRVDSPSPEVEFSMDESLIATAVNKDTAISVWSTATGERRFLFETQTGGRFKFSPNAQYLAATDSTVIRVWDLRGGSRLFERTRDAGQFGDVAFSSDGGVLAARSGNETVSGPFFGVNVWSIPDGDEVMRFPFNDEIDGIDFTRSGRHVLVSRNRSHGEEGSDDRITSWLLWSPQDLISEAEKRKTRDLTQEEWERYIPTEPVPPNLVKDN
jgi:WD40 repeat protein